MYKLGDTIRPERSSDITIILVDFTLFRTLVTLFSLTQIT